MRVLISAGPTWEPIDAVRYVGNRSSGKMGAALATAALARGDTVTLVCGPGVVPMPAGATRVDIETTAQLIDALAAAWPAHDLLVMAAAVADFRPRNVAPGKLGRGGMLSIECEATPDVVADLAATRRADQRVVAFALEAATDPAAGVGRAAEKMRRKGVDLMVHNPARTMSAPDIAATLIWPDGRTLDLPAGPKAHVAARLLAEAARLFYGPEPDQTRAG